MRLVARNGAVICGFAVRCLCGIAECSLGIERRDCANGR